MAILLTNSNFNGSSGAARIGPWKIYGNRPIAWAYTLQDNELTFVHELGHLMGAWHNREEMRDKNVYKKIKRDYSFGFQIRNTNDHTIMSYPTKHYNNWIPHFSIDEVDRKGHWLGNRYNDNSRTLRETRLVTQN
jgi:hypothetical protein